MKTGVIELQEALVAALKPALAPLGCPVRDHLDPKQAPPYLYLGSTQVEDWGDKDDPGTEQTLSFELYTRYRGRLEAHRISDAIYETLHEQDLELGADFQLVDLRFLDADSDLLEDGKTTFTRLRYRALVTTL